MFSDRRNLLNGALHENILTKILSEAWNFICWIELFNWFAVVDESISRHKHTLYRALIIAGYSS